MLLLYYFFNDENIKSIETHKAEKLLTENGSFTLTLKSTQTIDVCTNTNTK